MARIHTAWWWAIGILVAILMLSYVYIGTQGASTEAEKKQIRIGFMGPLTGDAASYGIGIKKGVELAIRDSKENARLIAEDSKCEGKEAVNAITKLVNVDRVQVIIGEVCSGATLAAAPIAESNKVVLISAASTSPKITGAGEYIFRVVPSDALQGDFGAQLVAKKGYKKLAILYSNEDYGVGFTEVLAASFTRLNGTVVAKEAFERGASDVRTQLTKIKAAKPDALYIISNSPDSAVAALRQIKELGITAARFGSEGLKGPEVAKSGVGEGLMVTSVSVGTSDFVAKHKAAYGEEPGPFAAQGYDAVTAVLRAIKGGASTGSEIKDALSRMIFDGASGRIAFDAKGDVAGNYDVYELRNATFVLAQ